MTSRKCPSCGAELSQSAKFCMKCGASVSEVSDQIVPPQLAKEVARQLGAQTGREIVKGILRELVASKKGGGPSSVANQQEAAMTVEKSDFEKMVACVAKWASSGGAEGAQPNINEDEERASLEFSMSSDGGDYKCFLDIQAQPLAYAIYAYSEIGVPDSHLDAVSALFSKANDGESIELEMVGDDNQVRCFIGVGLDEPAFTPEDVNKNLVLVLSKLDSAVREVGDLASNEAGDLPTNAGVTQSVTPSAQNASTNQSGSNHMRLTDVVNQWIAEQGWDDQPEFDEETQKSTTTFTYDMGDFQLKCFFEAHEEIGVFKIFMYYLEPKTPEKRLDEVRKLVYALDDRYVWSGKLELLAERRVIRFYNAFDFEGATFEPTHITNMMNAGLSGMKNIIPKYMAVCFGGKSTDEVMSEDE